MAFAARLILAVGHPGGWRQSARRARATPRIDVAGGCAALSSRASSRPLPGPPGLVKLQASVPAPPAVEGLSPTPTLRHILPRRQTLARFDFCLPKLADDLLHGVLLARYLALPVFGDGATLAPERFLSSVPA